MATSRTWTLHHKPIRARLRYFSCCTQTGDGFSAPKPLADAAPTQHLGPLQQLNPAKFEWQLRCGAMPMGVVWGSDYGHCYIDSNDGTRCSVHVVFGSCGGCHACNRWSWCDTWSLCQLLTGAEMKLRAWRRMEKLFHEQPTGRVLNGLGRRRTDFRALWTQRRGERAPRGELHVPRYASRGHAGKQEVVTVMVLFRIPTRYLVCLQATPTEIQ